jgi:hypothetical protein
MTRPKSLKVELLLATIDNLNGTRRMLQAMGKPMSTLSKMDDAIVAINHVLQSLESK